MKTWIRDFLIVAFGLVLLASMALAVVFTSDDARDVCVWQPCLTEASPSPTASPPAPLPEPSVTPAAPSPTASPPAPKPPAPKPPAVVQPPKPPAPKPPVPPAAVKAPNPPAPAAPRCEAMLAAALAPYDATGECVPAGTLSINGQPALGGTWVVQGCPTCQIHVRIERRGDVASTIRHEVCHVEQARATGYSDHGPAFRACAGADA